MHDKILGDADGIGVITEDGNMITELYLKILQILFLLALLHVADVR